ncbi:MAG: peptidoglycan editing factor PgeF [Campylobacterales bacterium]|nr:peptidoglycan editing factor PgeF [Campylobacterales bacterium]
MQIVLSSILLSNPKVTACFTTRHGGVSQAPYTTANLAFHVGDEYHNVLRNHDLLANDLYYDRKALIHMSQIHSDTIITIDDTHSFDTIPQCDALITNRLNTPIMVMSADCTPVLIYDPIHNAIGAVHAGRKGALNKILPKTLHAMNQAFDTQINDVQIVLGPSIHGCCYEVNENIVNEVIEKGYEDAIRRENKRVFLDVNTILLLQLRSLGVKKENIEVVNHCTSCNCDTYFSYRADAQHTGRIAGVIMLRPA